MQVYRICFGWCNPSPLRIKMAPFGRSLGFYLVRYRLVGIQEIGGAGWSSLYNQLCNGDSCWKLCQKLQTNKPCQNDWPIAIDWFYSKISGPILPKFNTLAWGTNKLFFIALNLVNSSYSYWIVNFFSCWSQAVYRPHLFYDCTIELDIKSLYRIYNYKLVKRIYSFIDI